MLNFINSWINMFHFAESARITDDHSKSKYKNLRFTSPLNIISLTYPNPRGSIQHQTVINLQVSCKLVNLLNLGIPITEVWLVQWTIHLLINRKWLISINVFCRCRVTCTIQLPYLPIFTGSISALYVLLFSGKVDIALWSPSLTWINFRPRMNN